MATAAQRSRAARVAALVRWSREDPALTATRGQAGLLARFEREVDPDGTLAPGERTKRADRLYRAPHDALGRPVRAGAAREVGDPVSAVRGSVRYLWHHPWGRLALCTIAIGLFAVAGVVTVVPLLYCVDLRGLRDAR